MKKSMTERVRLMQRYLGPSAAIGKALWKFRCLGLLTVMMLLPGCPSTSGPNKYSEIVNRIPPLASDKARIWFYLLREPQGTVVRTSDGQELCRLAQYGLEHYVMSFTDLPPGSYEMNNGLWVAPRKLRIQLAPGDTKYVRLIFDGTVIFRIIPPEVALQEMAQCRYKGNMALLLNAPPTKQEAQN